MRWQKVVLRSPACIYSGKTEKSPYVLDVQVAIKNDVWPSDYMYKKDSYVNKLESVIFVM